MAQVIITVPRTQHSCRRLAVQCTSLPAIATYCCKSRALPLTTKRHAMVRLPVWKYATSFYPAKIVKTAELDPDGNYIFCAHPHGIFCSSLFLAFATEAMDFSKLYPG
jgi:Diacylglycerol acyltransferase